MIKLTTLQGEAFYLNGDLIEKIQQAPDTLITLTVGKKIWVKEKPEEVVERFIEYKRNIYSTALGVKP